MRLEETEYAYFFKSKANGFYSGFSKKNISGIKIEKDIRLIFSLNKFSRLSLAYLRQTHSSQTIVVKKPGVYPGDGIFTSQRDLILAIRTADCLPVFFFGKNLWGLVHLGWKPAYYGILDNLPISFSRRRDFIAVCGPGLRQCCFEVKRDFLGWDKFSPFISSRKNKFFFDLALFLKEKLYEKGFRRENIFDLGLCSFCQSDKVYSFRRQKCSERTLSFLARF